MRASGDTAAVPTLSMTLSVSPKTAAAYTPVTWTGTLTPTNGPISNLYLTMGGFDYYQVSGTECTPVEFCQVDGQTHNPYWTFPVLTAKTVITTTWYPPPGLGRDPPPAYWDAAIQILSEGVSCQGTCPPVARLYGPTIKAAVSFTSNGPVLPGATLHVTVAVTSNAGPLGETLVNVHLPDGLADPTNVVPASSTVYPAPNRHIEDVVTFGTSTELTFDTVIGAAIGSNLQLTYEVTPIPDWDGRIHGTKTIHVGPTPTQTPRPPATTKPRSSTTPSVPSPTVAPSATDPGVASSSSSPSTTASDGPGSSSTPGADPAGPSAPAGTGVGVLSPGEGPSVVFLAAGIVVVVVVALGLRVRPGRR
jgi:hypothetical protein